MLYRVYYYIIIYLISYILNIINVGIVFHDVSKYSVSIEQGVIEPVTF